jgi:hypothetical protein
MRVTPFLPPWSADRAALSKQERSARLCEDVDRFLRNEALAEEYAFELLEELQQRAVP